LSASENCFPRFPRHLPSFFCHCSEEPWLVSQVSLAIYFSRQTIEENKKVNRSIRLAIREHNREVVAF